MSTKSLRLWSRKEVAEYFDVSELTVLRMIRNEEIPAYKIKGQWKLKQEDIDSYLQQCSNINSEKETPKKGRILHKKT